MFWFFKKNTYRLYEVINENELFHINTFKKKSDIDVMSEHASYTNRGGNSGWTFVKDEDGLTYTIPNNGVMRKYYIKQVKKGDE